MQFFLANKRCYFETQMDLNYTQHSAETIQATNCIPIHKTRPVFCSHWIPAQNTGKSKWPNSISWINEFHCMESERLLRRMTNEFYRREELRPLYTELEIHALCEKVPQLADHRVIILNRGSMFAFQRREFPPPLSSAHRLLP